MYRTPRHPDFFNFFFSVVHQSKGIKIVCFQLSNVPLLLVVDLLAQIRSNELMTTFINQDVFPLQVLIHVQEAVKSIQESYELWANFFIIYLFFFAFSQILAQPFIQSLRLYICFKVINYSTSIQLQLEWMNGCLIENLSQPL